MNRIALDTGPLIGLFFEGDAYHQQARAGFEQLQRLHTRLLTPISVVFEVYKWLLQRSSPFIAQQSLGAMLSTLDINSNVQIEALYNLVRSVPNWKGSLEDASVILVAQGYKCSVWTLNYRDFSRFSFLDFWYP